MSNFKFFDNNNSVEETTSKPLENTNDVDFRLKSSKGSSFQIDYDSELIALGNKVLGIKSESVWTVTDIEVVTDGYIVMVEVTRHDVINSNQLLNGMIDFSKLFNVPLVEMVLKLDLAGNLKEVLNRQQVFKRWQEVREQLIPVLSPEEVKMIIPNADQQFNNPVTMLQSAIVYNLFFMPVYGHKVKGETKTIASGRFTSQLFQDKIIPYTITNKVENINPADIELNFDSDISAFNKKDLESIYNAVYKEALNGDNFDYNISLTGRGTYDVQTGQARSCFFKITEKAHPNLFFEGSYLIRKV